MQNVVHLENVTHHHVHHLTDGGILKLERIAPAFNRRRGFGCCNHAVIAANDAWFIAFGFCRAFALCIVGFLAGQHHKVVCTRNRTRSGCTLSRRSIFVGSRLAHSRCHSDLRILHGGGVVST